MLRGKVSPHEVTKDSIRYLSFYSLDLASIIQVTVASHRSVRKYRCIFML